MPLPGAGNIFSILSLKRCCLQTNYGRQHHGEVNILSSARPVTPQVEYVIPTFEWNRTTTGKKTVTGRISGLRVYLKRPWYKQQRGEQLAVVLMFQKISDNV
ncbi:MAG: hypothetical protein IPF69_12920 [Chitinophagaceae bacterium]|nr:hypothetical protein [Chitinophagaceae bacterium]